MTRSLFLFIFSTILVLNYGFNVDVSNTGVRTVNSPILQFWLEDNRRVYPASYFGYEVSMEGSKT